MCVLLSACTSLSGNRRAETLGAHLIQRGSVTNINLERVWAPLEWMWDNTNNYEWLGCVQARYDGIEDIVHVEAIELAEVYMSSPDSVSGGCRNTAQFIGTIHPHTNGFCGFSTSDMESQAKDENEAFMMIQCNHQNLIISTEKVKIRGMPEDTIDIHDEFSYIPSVPRAH